MQMRVTRSLPASDGGYIEIFDSATTHLAAVRLAPGVEDVATPKGYGFGAGWHLGVAIALAASGVGSTSARQADLVNHTVSILSRQHPELGSISEAVALDDVQDILAALAIDYRAMDARATDLTAESVNFITSTSTLEHIPANQLVRSSLSVVASGIVA